MYALDMVRTIAGVERSEWDQLAGHNVFASYGWLRTVEESSTVPLPHFYFMLRDAAGCAAVSHCHLQEKGLPRVDLDTVLFGRLAGAASFCRLSVLPALVCGVGAGLAESVFVRQGTSVAECGRLIGLVVEAMERLAEENGWTLCFRGVAAERSEAGSVLQDRGYLHTLELPISYLDLEWSSFEEYLRHLKKIHPATAKSVRGEINRLRRGGITIEETKEPARHQASLHRLLNAHYFRLNQKPFAFRPNLFQCLKNYLPDQAAVYVATDGEQLIGVTIALRDKDAVYLPMIGVAPARSGERVRKDAAYFNLVFNQPIRDFIAARCPRLYYGRLLYNMKARRGCRLLYGMLYVRGRSRLHELLLQPLFALQGRRIRQMEAVTVRRRWVSASAKVSATKASVRC